MNSRKSDQDNTMYYSLNDAIVYRIQSLCVQNNISINKLSKLGGVPQSTLNEIMQKRTMRPKIDTIKKIAFGFGITLKDFFDDPIFERIKGIDDQR